MNATMVEASVVRAATVSDVDAIVQLVMEFGDARDYRDLIFTTQAQALPELVRRCFSVHGCVFVLEVDGAVVGFIAAMLSHNELSLEAMASELIWFVQPQHRGDGRVLLAKVEAWAITRGAARLSLIAPTERMEAIYRRLGYSALDRVYVKELSRESVLPPVVDGVTLREVTPDDLERVWHWLLQFRDNNFDDGGADTLEDFTQMIVARANAGTQYRIVEAPRYGPCGFIGITPTSTRHAQFQGICFTKDVHGTGITYTAVRQAISHVFAEGIDKISAAYFAHNTRVDAFFRKLGAQHEGTLRRHARQHGHPVDMTLVAIFAPSVDVEVSLCQQVD